MFKSKRFIAFAIAMLVFIVTTYTTAYPPIELATALTLLTAIYLGAQTFRGSTPDNKL